MPDPDGLPELIRRIAATSLPDSSEGAPVGVPPAAWPRILGRVVQERLSGLAVAAAQDGWLQLNDDQFAELLGQHRDAMTWTLRVERILLVVSRRLEARGVRPIVLKGPALAHTLYPDPSWRAFRDLDLLVRPRLAGGAGSRGDVEDRGDVLPRGVRVANLGTEHGGTGHCPRRAG